MTRIGEDIPEEAFDENAKRLLSNKRIFAYIIREADDRFRDLEVEQILGMMDDNKESDYLLSIDKECSIYNRKNVADGCFIINVPDGSKLLVDMEFQASRNTSHCQLAYRMYDTTLYSAVRMNNLKKDKLLGIGDEVLTIWIDSNPLVEYANTIRFFP